MTEVECITQYTALASNDDDDDDTDVKIFWLLTQFRFLVNLSRLYGTTAYSLFVVISLLDQTNIKPRVEQDETSRYPDQISHQADVNDKRAFGSNQRCGMYTSHVTSQRKT